MYIYIHLQYYYTLTLESSTRWRCIEEKPVDKNPQESKHKKYKVYIIYITRIPQTANNQTHCEYNHCFYIQPTFLVNILYIFYFNGV